MKWSKFKNALASAYIVFSIITVGFIGFLVFEDLKNDVSVEAVSTWTQNTEADFYNGTLNNLQIKENNFLLQESEIFINTNIKAFTENKGQLENDEIRFYVQNSNIWFTDDGVWFNIREYSPIQNQESRNRESRIPWNPVERQVSPKPIIRKGVTLKQEFVGANPVRPNGRERLNWNNNYFYGNNSSKWCNEVANYKEIYYKNLYNRIDLKFYLNEKGLKYDFILHPGANANQIRIKYLGAEKLEINCYKDLKIETALYDILDSNLFIYQKYNGNKHQVKGQFIIFDNFEYGFEIMEEYNNNEALIIDPFLEYSTYFGGNDNDSCSGIAVDSEGNVIITGHTASLDFPITPGAYQTTIIAAYDLFVSKLNIDNSQLIYSTYIGGSAGADFAFDLALDSIGNAYVTGTTYSSDFPTTPNAFDTNNFDIDIFILKLSTNGSLLYSTFIGNNDDLEISYGIDVDIMGNVFITGQAGTNFPTTSGAYDITLDGETDLFVLKLNHNGTELNYSTYIGGNSGEVSYDIAVDLLGNAYVIGITGSKDFPITPNAYNKSFNYSSGDVFILKLNKNGSKIIYSTYIGGKGDADGYGIKVDPSGNAVITGITSSYNFPPTTENSYDTTFNGDLDGFVMKFNQNGSELIFSTLIGGSSFEYCYDIALDLDGDIYLTGYTNSSDFPITSDAFQLTKNEIDGFLFKLSSDGSKIIYSTYFGGSDFDGSGNLDLDSMGNAYIVGNTYSFDFPTTPDAFNRTLNGEVDVVILKFNKTNIFPSVLDLNISKSMVYRTNPIYLFSNGTDFRDHESELFPFFEYRDPNERVWNKSYFSIPYFNNSRWEVIFTPPKKASLGLYDFRIKFCNTYGLFSSWFYLNNSLSVLNNIPFIEDLFLSKNKAFIGDTVAIWVNGTDVEEPQMNLTIDLKNRDPNEQTWNITYLDSSRYFNERWNNNFNIPHNAPFGYYDFKVRINDSDKDFSEWFYANNTLLIQNKNPKVVDIQISKNPVLRTNSVFLYINGTDHETPESSLSLLIQYKSIRKNDWKNLTGKYSFPKGRWEVEFITTINLTLGFYDFRINFIDNVSTSSGWYYSNMSLRVLNNNPHIEDFGVSKSIVFRTNTIIIYINATDIENSENILKHDIQYKSPLGTWTTIANSSFIFNYWIANFTPLINAEIGFYDIRINFTDMDNGYSGWTIIKNAFEVKNNLPVISNMCDDFKIDFRTKYIDLTQYESDIEDSDLDLTWNIYPSSVEPTLFLIDIIDISGDIIRIIPMENISGSDDITLILTDKDGDNITKWDVTFYVNSVINYYFQVSISVFPESVIIKQDNNQNVTLKISNKGILSDNYTIAFYSNYFSTQHIQFEKNLISVSSGEIKDVNVTINVPKDCKLDTYKITFNVVSEYASDNTILAVNVKAKVAGTNIEEYYLMLIVSILIIVIVVIIIMLIIKKQRKKEDLKSIFPGSVTIKPSAISNEIITQDQTPKSSKFVEVSRSIASDDSQQRLLSVSPEPKLIEPSQVTSNLKTTQIPQITQLPQLPPTTGTQLIDNDKDINISQNQEPVTAP